MSHNNENRQTLLTVYVLTSVWSAVSPPFSEYSFINDGYNEPENGECVYGDRWAGGQHVAEPQPQAEAETEAIFEPEGEDMQVPHLA